MKIAGSLVAVVVCFAVVVAFATPAQAADKVVLCHATGQPDNWVRLSVDRNAVVKQGHTTHQDGRDIIPPFEYLKGSQTIAYPGLNWGNAGRAIWANGCVNPEPPLQVTFVARACSTYDEIFANRNRNNLMQSLEDLGPDSPYRAGDQVLPTVEARAPQDRCRPLVGWRFTLGAGRASARDSGPWGSLSRVSTPYATEVSTRDSVPLVNVMGGPTGMSIEGAVTVELTEAQAARSIQPGRLWVQGGVPTDPVLSGLFGDRFSFAALRCATDVLNGDNVEWISFPSGQTTVYCFAYYVEERPERGTIEIVKEVSSASGALVEQRALFDGTFNFDDRPIAIEASTIRPGRAEFVRAATAAGQDPWTIVEEIEPGWRLDGVECTAEGGSTWQVDGATVAVRLAADDRVTCAYRNVVQPPVSQTLTLQARTLGAGGRLSAQIESPDGAIAGTVSMRTTASGEVSVPSNVSLPVAGAYRVEVGIPVSSFGTWALREVRCNGQEVDFDDEGFRVPIAMGAGAACIIETKLTPSGAITIRKATIGGVASVGFAVWRADTEDEDAIVHHLRAMTVRPGDAVPEIARPLPGAIAPVRLAPGEYVIQEMTDAFTGADEWALESVVCDGVAQSATAGRVVVRLTETNPRLDCSFTNRLEPGAMRGAPGPAGPGMPASGYPPEPQLEHRAALRVTLRAQPRWVFGWGTVRYVATVRNAGPDAARNVFVTLSGPAAVRPRAAKASRGKCHAMRGVVTCRIGILRRGQSVTISATRAIDVVSFPRGTRSRPGRYTVHAAVTTSTHQRSTAANRSSVKVGLVAAPESVTG